MGSFTLHRLNTHACFKVQAKTISTTLAVIMDGQMYIECGSRPEWDHLRTSGLRLERKAAGL